MKICPLCCTDDIQYETLTVSPDELLFSRVLHVLQCNNCGYWVPCSRLGHVPTTKEEQEKRDE